MVDVSVIIPIRNGEVWIDSCMKSIASQTIFSTNIKLEIVIFNDGSTDKTLDILDSWEAYFSCRGVNFVVTGSANSLGVGTAKNNAIKVSKGEYLCFQDIDDVMSPDRIKLQYSAASLNKNALVGCKVSRVPVGSTPRFVRWANELDESLLAVQIYTSNGPTLLMPTWFCHRSVYEKVGGFDESGKGTPEDLLFFYKHLDVGGDLIKINEVLLQYTYHEDATTFSIPRECIWKIQLNRIENFVLPYWENVTIWNAGRAGKRLVRSLSKVSRSKIVAFCDVDIMKIGRNVELYCPKLRANIVTLPVIHFSKAKPPLIICVKFYLSGGVFESNLKSLNLNEGKDYILFN